MKPFLPVFVVTVLLWAGCSSMMREPEMEMKVTVNPAAPKREIKSYVITCSNELISRWFLSDPKAVMTLGAALEKQGYEEALDPATAVYVIKVDIGFGPRATMQPMENPDSIRYMNVAAMAGQGRYSQILTERNESSGSLLVGPNGQIIATGGWKRVMEDSERAQHPVDRGGDGYDLFVLRVCEAGAVDKKSEMVAWEVAVRRPVDYRTPSPEHVGMMLRQAASLIESGLSSSPSSPAATPPAGKS